MAVMNTVQNSTMPKVDDNPPGGELSPTTIILNDLKRRGVPITPDNIRRAVIANARDPGTSGPDLGYVSDTGRQISLRNAAPETDGPGVGQGGNVAGKVEGSGRGGGRNLPVPPVPPSERAQAGPVDRRDDQSSSPATSAPPTSAMDLTGLGAAILGGGAGLYGMGRYLGRPMPIGGDAARPVPNFTLANEFGPWPAPDVPPGVPAVAGQEYAGRAPTGPNGRVVDVNPPGLPAPQGALPAPPTDMEVAMQKALAPASNPMLGAPTPETDPYGIIRGGQSLPPGVSDVDALRAAQGGNQLQIEPPPAPPRRPVTVPIPQAANDLNPTAADIAQRVLRMFGGRR